MRILVIFTFFLSFSVNAQSVIQSLLEAPISDFEYEEIAVSQSYLNSENFNSPWLRDVDFRVRARNDASIEEYRMRFGLINPLEIMANKKYQNILDETLSLRKEVRIKQVLEQRMNLVIERLRLEMRLAQVDSTIEFLKNIREIVLTDVNEKVVEDLIEIEGDLFKAQLDKQNFISRYEVNTFLIKKRTSREVLVTIDSAYFISITKMSADILNISLQDAQLTLADHELKLEESLFSIQKAEAWSNIGFVQAEYDIDRGDSFNDHMGYQIGVTLPIFNSKKPDLKREKLDLIEEEVQQKSDRSAIQEEFDTQRMRFNHQLKSWYLSDNYKIQLSKIESLGITTVKSVIALNKKEQSLNAWQIDALAGIWQTYINLKFSSAAGDGYYNYLSKNQEALSLPVD